MLPAHLRGARAQLAAAVRGALVIHEQVSSKPGSLQKACGCFRKRLRVPGVFTCMAAVGSSSRCAAFPCMVQEKPKGSGAFSTVYAASYNGAAAVAKVRCAMMASLLLHNRS